MSDTDSFWSSILELFNELFSRTVNPDRKRERETITGGNGPTFEISIHQSKKLSSLRGRIPEKMVALYLAQAIENAGYGYRIHYGFRKEYAPPSETNSVESLDWWAENSSENATTCNMLLYDAPGGGRACYGENHAIVGMREVIEVDDTAKEVCKSESCSNAWAAIHELGHNLGGRHKTPMMHPKPGMLFSDEMKELIDKRVESGEIETI